MDSGHCLKILIIDDRYIFRKGLKAIIGITPNREVIGEGSDLLELEALLENITPDLIILALPLTPQDSKDTLSRLLKKRPEAKYLIMLQFLEVGAILTCLQHGAWGIISRDCSFPELEKALAAFEEGYPYLDQATLLKLVTGIRTIPWEFPPAPTILVVLSAREREIFWMILKGQDSKTIASELFLSKKTVDNHRSTIYKKLKVVGLRGVLKLAREEGLL